MGTTLVEELEQAAKDTGELLGKYAVTDVDYYDELLARADRLHARAERVRELADAGCAHCSRPAVCIGVYEDPEGPIELACDGCCGHGNEDGWCKPLFEYLTGPLPATPPETPGDPQEKGPTRGT